MKGKQTRTNSGLKKLNMKTAKEKAKEWNCRINEVREYCKIIPNAYRSNKFPFKWLVPDIPKPPMKYKEAIKFIEKIDLIKEGAEINFSKIGYDINNTNEIYTYLADNGYITRLNNEENLNDKLKSTIVTSLGKQLMNSCVKNNIISKTTTKSTHAELNTGVFQAGAKIETVTDEKVPVCN